MSDGSTLPRAEGDGSVAQVICKILAARTSLVSSPTLMSATTIKLASEKLHYNKDVDEFAALGSMEFEVVPADRLKKPKLYDWTESKKAAEKVLPKNPLQPGSLPNRAYVKLPILKRPAPVQPVCPTEEDDTMGEIYVE